MKHEEIIGVVEDLNIEIYEKSKLEYIYLEYMTNGFASKIQFLGIAIWTDQEDDRIYDEEEDSYEPLDEYLRRTINFELERLNKIF